MMRKKSFGAFSNAIRALLASRVIPQLAPSLPPSVLPLQITPKLPPRCPPECYCFTADDGE